MCPHIIRIRYRFILDLIDQFCIQELIIELNEINLSYVVRSGDELV